MAAISFAMGSVTQNAVGSSNVFQSTAQPAPAASKRTAIERVRIGASTIQAEEGQGVLSRIRRFRTEKDSRGRWLALNRRGHHHDRRKGVKHKGAGAPPRGRPSP